MRNYYNRKIIRVPSKHANQKNQSTDPQKFPAYTSPLKGQSILLTHAILVSFAIFLVFAVFTGLTTLRTDFENFVADKEIKQSCLLVRGGIEKIYVNTDYRSNDNVTAGSIVLQMPERLAGASYRLSFDNNSIVIDGRPLFNTTCKTGFNLSYKGSSTGGLVQMKYVRYGNGTDAIEMSNI